MMSMKGISSAEPDKLSRRISTHKRSNDAHSGELDVFEAAVYLSGHNEASSPDSRHAQKYGYNMAREENRRRWGILGGGRRISLDLPIRYSEQVHHHLHHEKHEVTTNMKERISNVRHKQPSSPGGRIASFLNSLFHQTGSKKNKPKPKPTDREVEEEIPGGGGGWMKRRRRSSISHFLSSSRSNSTTTTTTTSSSKSLFSSSSSGFRTPPPYLNTPTKSYKQFLNYTTAATNQVGDENEKKINKELSWLDEKLKVMESLSEKQKVWAEHEHNNDDRRIKKERYDDDDNDDGMESDSSSDLFELQNYELSRGGLPVYETTNVANINNTHT